LKQNSSGIGYRLIGSKDGDKMGCAARRSLALDKWGSSGGKAEPFRTAKAAEPQSLDFGEFSNTIQSCGKIISCTSRLFLCLSPFIQKERRRGVSNEEKERVDYYLNELCGENADDAFHSLLEAPDKAVPFIIEGYTKLTDSEVRATVIKILAERKGRLIMPFFERALQDQDELVWKAALNALVSIGAGEPLSILLRTKSRLKILGDDKFMRWLDEAIEELESDDPT
jgi:hypothetical protein